MARQPDMIVKIVDADGEPDQTVAVIDGISDLNPTNGDTLVYNATTGKWENQPPAASVTAADYLVGTAQAGLSAEIVVGATPGGELGNTWASPTVDASHSGSTHAAVQAAAEAAPPPYVSRAISATTPQSLASGGSGAALSWGQELEDAVSGVWAGGNPTRFTMPAGKTRMRITVGVTFEANAIGVRQIYSRQDGSVYGRGYLTQTIANVGASSSVSFSAQSGIYEMAAGSYIEIIAYQDSEVALNVAAATFIVVEVW